MTDQQQAVINDPWESSENPVFRSGEYWGQIAIDAWYCVLAKGTGKVPFDAQVHKIEDRRTSIEMQLHPLPEQNISFEVARSTIAESKGWASITLPSIKQFGLSLREMNNKWVKLGFKPTGRKYTNSQGEEKENTTFEFLKVFNSEAECRTDYSGNSSGDAQPTATEATANGDDKKRATALAFLKVVVKQAADASGHDLDAIRDSVSKRIAQYPNVAEFFTVDSPETVELIAETLK